MAQECTGRLSHCHLAEPLAVSGNSWPICKALLHLLCTGACTERALFLSVVLQMWALINENRSIVSLGEVAYK